MKIVDLRGKLPVHKTKKYNTRKISDVRSIAIHHSLTVSGTPEAFANYHVTTNGWPGIAYTYVVQRDGTVYQCWDHTIVGYHVGNSNKHSLGICMVGDFRTQKPTDEQYKAVLELTRWLQGQLPNVTSVKGHSEFPDYSWKACPVIDMNKFRSDLIKKEPIINEEDLPMTKEEKKTFDELKGMVDKQTKIITTLNENIKTLQDRSKMSKIPDWAKDSVAAAVDAGLIDTPENGSYDFYRLLTVLYRKKII